MQTATLKKSPTQNAALKNIQQQVTDIIIQQLEAGTIPWQQPWSGSTQKLLGLPYNFTTRNYYQGMNIILLWCSSLKNNFTTDEWAGFQQWKDRGEAVRKDEKGSLIVYYTTLEKEVGDEITKIPMLKSLKVFNRCQLVSHDPDKYQEEKPKKSLVEKIAVVDEFISNTGAIVEHHDGGACYRPSCDKILMPYPEKFRDTVTCTATEGYYSSTLHELIHWSGSSHRLNRTKGMKFGDQNYAIEELVAELGAAFLTAGFGLATVEKGDHAGYIENWLKVIKENNRSIFVAAGEASKAVEYLHHFGPENTL